MREKRSPRAGLRSHHSGMGHLHLEIHLHVLSQRQFLSQLIRSHNPRILFLLRRVPSMLACVVDDGAIPAHQSPFGLGKHNTRMARLAAAVLISSVGDPFTQAVSLVLLYQATRAPLAIAAAFGAEMLGVLTVGGLIGAIAARVDRRRLLVRLEASPF